MFRPLRMTSASIICLKRDIDIILEGLSQFGEFHIDKAVEKQKLTEYDRSVQKVEEALANVNDLIKQLGTEKTGLLDIFRDVEPVRTKITAENWQKLLELNTQEILELKLEAGKLSTALVELREKTAAINHVLDMLDILANMNADLTAMEELRLIHVAIASVPNKNRPNLERALAGFPLIFHRCYLERQTDFVCMAFPSKYTRDIERILKTFHSEIFQVPDDLPHNVTEASVIVRKQLKENVQKEKDTEELLRKLITSNSNKLISLKETSQNILSLLFAKQKILQSNMLATITGFVPKKQFNKLREKVESKLKGAVLVLENQVAAAEDPPTKISNNRLVKPFEEITKLYGLPHYDELDPTPFIAVTFPIIFGLMFGDMGHGLVLLIGGLTLGFLIKKKSSIKNMCWILAACGLGAVFAGLLFGEFFGKQIFAPLWFSPFNNVLGFLIFSLVVGVFQIVSGLVLELVDFVLRRNVFDALLTSIPKIAFYIGSVYLIAVYQLNFAAWLSGPILFALVPFLVLVFGKTIVSRFEAFSVTDIEGHKKGVSLGERFFESSDFVARLLSNTMSYTRILALLMAHWALILVTYVIAGLVGSSSILGIVLGGIVIVAGNIFVIALEGLIVFIHALRLHFYEWFSKFYEGSGSPFSPYKQEFIYTEITLDKN
jgi:V/A-type H+/Na+-transporting ATPase subunit I